MTDRQFDELMSALHGVIWFLFFIAIFSGMTMFAAFLLLKGAKP